MSLSDLMLPPSVCIAPSEPRLFADFVRATKRGSEHLQHWRITQQPKVALIAVIFV